MFNPTSSQCSKSYNTAINHKYYSMLRTCLIIFFSANTTRTKNNRYQQMTFNFPSFQHGSMLATLDALYFGSK